MLECIILEYTYEVLHTPRYPAPLQWSGIAGHNVFQFILYFLDLKDLIFSCRWFAVFENWHCNDNYVRVHLYLIDHSLHQWLSVALWQIAWSDLLDLHFCRYAVLLCTLQECYYYGNITVGALRCSFGCEPLHLSSPVSEQWVTQHLYSFSKGQTKHAVWRVHTKGLRPYRTLTT